MPNQFSDPFISYPHGYSKVLVHRLSPSSQSQASLPNNPQPINKPSKAQHSKHSHAHHQPECPPLRLPQRPTTSSTLPASKIRVRLRHIHPKRILIIRRQIARLRSSTYATRRIINNKRVRLRQQGVRDGCCLVRPGIPRHDAGVVPDGLVRGNGVELLICCTSCHDVDGRGRAEERGVVPAKGDVGADFVVLGARGDGGCHEGDATGGVGGIVGGLVG
jgi:hypothetical protein